MSNDSDTGGSERNCPNCGYGAARRASLQPALKTPDGRELEYLECSNPDCRVQVFADGDYFTDNEQ